MLPALGKQLSYGLRMLWAVDVNWLCTMPVHKVQSNGYGIKLLKEEFMMYGQTIVAIFLVITYVIWKG